MLIRAKGAVAAAETIDGNGKMLSLDRLNETIELCRFIVYSFSIEFDDVDDIDPKTAADNETKLKRFRYADFCEPYCEYNWPLELFVVCERVVWKWAFEKKLVPEKKL